MFDTSSSSVMPTLPTATPMHSTFFSWNLIVALTSFILPFRSSLWVMGVGNLPAVAMLALASSRMPPAFRMIRCGLTLRETGPQKTRDLPHEHVRGDEGVVLARQLLDQLLVLVELLQIVGRHRVDAVVLGSIDVMLISENAIGRSATNFPHGPSEACERNAPNVHARARDLGQLDRARETLVTLRVIVLEPDLELDRLKEVALLLVVGVIEQFLHVRAHSGYGKGLAQPWERTS